ncbi:hypothetical protein [Rhodoferax antarcticus]|uniref:hypothetical protein n=1 Tax=Rhodoferax antarcticus TaxID=81479 RepID=UPI001F524E36|nr:hypothetical protein [Rhodoferax antarcticus]
MPTDALPLGQSRDLGFFCKCQYGKTLALVGWHVGGNALWVIHLALASREKEQCPRWVGGRSQRLYWLAVWISLKKCYPLLNHAAVSAKKITAPTKALKPTVKVAAKAAVKKAPVSKTARSLARLGASIAKLTERKDKISAEI